MNKHHIIFIIVGAIVLIIIGGFLFTWVPVFFTGFGQQDNNQLAISYSKSNKSSQSQSTSQSNNAELVGTWESDCLIPDPSSKWAEKHQFVITKDGATHTRWSNDTAPNCDSFGMTLVNKYTYTTTSSGQINFTDTEQGGTFYDIYQLTGSALEFGHGFRNKLAYPAQDGSVSNKRIDSLNTYIIYKKK